MNPYLFKLNKIITVIMADNIPDAIDKAEEVCKDWEMMYHRSLELIK